MIEIEVRIIEYTNDQQPGWVRFEIIDAFGKSWYFEDKVPVVTMELLDSNSKYPQNGYIAVTVNDVFIDRNNVSLAIIDTSKPWGITAENGETIFTILKKQLIAN